MEDKKMEEEKNFYDYLKETEDKVSNNEYECLLESYFYCNHIVEY